MSAVWAEWWRGRTYRARTTAERGSALLERILDHYGPSIAEWVAANDTLKDWYALRIGPLGTMAPVGAGPWAERAEAVEQAADRFALVLTATHEHHYLPAPLYDAVERFLTDWRISRERRYEALPTGHTLQGNLTSGGIDV
ncbi:MAG: hypothetical protein ACREMY_05000 [bacterium]